MSGSRAAEDSRSCKVKLRRLYRSLNRAQLHRRILALQESLLQLAARNPCWCNPS